MRKIILFNMVSLDGFFEGSGHDINWHNVDDEFNDFAVRQLGEAGGLIFGRVTYELMAGYWPSELGQRDDPQVAERMNALPKYVFSRTLECVDWSGSYLITSEAGAGARKLKEQSGKDLFLFGSADLAATLAREHLIDEYRLLVNPVTLGRGTPLFKDGAAHKFTLAGVRKFRNGNVLLTYHPVDDDRLPRAIGQPATRALAAIGVTRLEQVAGHGADELLQLHGMGPRAIGILRAALAERGLSFADR